MAELEPRAYDYSSWEALGLADTAHTCYRDRPEEKGGCKTVAFALALAEGMQGRTEESRPVHGRHSQHWPQQVADQRL